GREVARVPNLDALSAVVESLPEETLCRYFQEGQLRRWLWTRTEFSLARRLEVEGFSTPDPVQLRRLIHQAIEEEQERSRRGSVVTYSRRFHPEHWHLAQIGGGSLGGKGRGLAFFDKVMAENLDPARWPGVKVGIPRTLILRTEVFEEFVRRNDLLEWAIVSCNRSCRQPWWETSAILSAKYVVPWLSVLPPSWKTRFTSPSPVFT
ncbi:MAG: hypothetical protein NTV33_09655, partial [Coprothermobacterota bacterium]|nr:hypothetical protein [Coprothermobacterota bacterium]